MINSLDDNYRPQYDLKLVAEIVKRITDDLRKMSTLPKGGHAVMDTLINLLANAAVDLREKPEHVREAFNRAYDYYWNLTHD